MYRRLCLLIPLLSLFACASIRPRMGVEEWFDFETQRWAEAVSNSCLATHDNYVAGKSPVDCDSKPPKALMMSFPSRDFFIQHEQGIAEYLSTWCVAVSNRYGEMPTVGLELREEKVTHQRGCKHILDRTRNLR